ncbi:PEP phosphonomutase-like enzyme [Desulfosporosinus orientis DSM 765]|uniref:2-methylisocitrate lyase n=1 Tax=Desulfosporosinus orientis (strain ATCC 19365 / DSM 765 / NCIMB 8382 / VKM B-1628 / Singapore I) TaxID=768706 RepID=G7W7U7_DESOD|nr:isocitrate lyase/PEP mutase family protein [Desulfosporosinus orientis]AET66162.1 PEP phosphonomutase-like enzyme [Desulfosporosinus orientis DSM 765]
MNKGKVLRRLLADKEILIAPGAHDVLTAKIIEKAGFQAVYMTGYGQAASHLGTADVGLMTMSEMLERANNFAGAVDVPVIADGDTGFGNAINVMRTVRQYEMVGVAAIQLEDQLAPKKCGHMTGRQVIPTEEMVGKIKAAVEARKDPDFVIIARTDARTIHGIDEAVQRAKAYEEAGADVIFVESPESVEEMKIITSSFKVPVLANMVEGGRTPLLAAPELEELGYDMVIFPTASTYMVAQAMKNLMAELMKSGTTKNLLPEMISFTDFNDLIGLPEIRMLENKFVIG